MKVLCIYHGNCQDGFGAAWAVRHGFDPRRIEFHAGVYQDPPPDVTGRNVLLVDFSYKRPVLLEMAKKARSILILDHHKSAAEDLAGFRELAPHDQWDDDTLELVAESPEKIAVLFDMNRSGAGIAWDFFHHLVLRPSLIDHIEDRDLWRFKLDGTREISAALFSHPYDFELWDRLMQEDHIETLKAEGAAITRKHFQDIENLLPVVTRKMRIAGELVPVANLPLTMTSDAGHLLCDRHGAPFAACYWDTPDGRVFSLRSKDDGADVSAIAKQYGGGGHRNASGFRVPHAELGARGLVFV